MGRGMSIYDIDPDTGLYRGYRAFENPPASTERPRQPAVSETRVCLRCGRDLSHEMGCYVFADGKPVPGLLCVEHGSNGANGMSRAEYERLLESQP
jgi:hypothetical protein